MLMDNRPIGQRYRETDEEENNRICTALDRIPHDQTVIYLIVGGDGFDTCKYVFYFQFTLDFPRKTRKENN
jgi:hypothetical protein